MSFIDRLRETQRDTKKPRLFEEVLTKAFEKLGFTSKHIGGRDEPDILLEILGHKIVIDAKTATDPIGEARINFDALERYKKSYRADHVSVLAIGFTSGVVRKTAKERDVILIETEAICKALQNHMNYPYNPKHIYEMLFESGKTVITSRDIEPSTKNVSQQIDMIKKVLSDLNRLQKSRQKFNIDDAVVAYRWENPAVKKQEIEDALMFLSSPPFNVVKEEDGVYSLTLDFDEIQKRLALLHEALPTPEPVRGRERLGHNVYRHRLTRSDVKHKFISISARMRSFFPEPGVEFTIESDDKKYVVSCDKYNRIFSGASKWYNDNPAVEEGGVVLLQRLQDKVYRLTVE